MREAGSGTCARHFLPRRCRFFAIRATALLLAVALAGCGSVSMRDSPVPSAPRAGGYYLNDGPHANPPANLDQVPDAVAKREPLRRATMRPYTVMERHYVPMTQLAPYKARGVASWYGRRYHGQKTASGEIYDMYAMTAAHTILPIPSYARVTNLSSRKSVVVRINDRGPFHADRLIDLSYTAAYKLGVLGGGRSLVEVEAIISDAEIAGRAPVPVVAEAQSAAPGPGKGSGGAATPESLPAANVAGSVYLQLAAFGSQDNAESYLTRLRAQIEWLGPALHVYPRDGLFRVHAGPYANQAEARAAAGRISQALGIEPMVLMR